MNARERFRGINEFDPEVVAPRWEMGYWAGTLEHWYDEGLPKKRYLKIPKTRHVYANVFSRFAYRDGRFADGLAVMGGLWWPSQGLPLDNDVKNYFDMDEALILVPANGLFCPEFEFTVLDEDEDKVTHVDIDGVKRIYDKRTGVIPTQLECPIKDWESWHRLKEERMRLEDVGKRLPPNWDELLEKYKHRTFPLLVGGYPCGMFGILAHLMGYERLFYTIFDDPKLIHDILGRFTDIWIALYTEIAAQVELDGLLIWEDVSFNRGSMLPPWAVKEFMLPYYRKVVNALKGVGIKYYWVDTDGNCTELIGPFMDAGVTGMYPMEANSGMDILQVRKDFPMLAMCGGLPKLDIRLGKARIDEFLEPVKPLLRSGGYVPHGDHLIPPEVDWENFKYYRTRLNSMMDSKGHEPRFTSGGR